MTIGYDSSGQRRVSKSSVGSLICGILGCVPFLTGFLAVVLGIMGISRTSGARKKGRWMAVVGLLLGIASLAVWSGVALVGGGVVAIVMGTQAPRTAAHDFIKAAADGNDSAAKSLTAGISDDDYDDIAAHIRKEGSFISTTFNSTNINNDSAHVEGDAEFSGGHHPVSADLERIGGKWRVKEIHISDEGGGSGSLKSSTSPTPPEL